jgi:hypothetical protein
VLQALDTDAEQRTLARYFEHLYADRDGAVFAGVTLYDAWLSRKVVEMPDTDAIAFARGILRTDAYVAPIPGDRRRERLYEKVAAAFARHHEHRTLRLALAATFVAAEPPLPPEWETLARRCHWLWQTCGRDPAAVALRLRDTADRADWVRRTDEALRSDDEPARRHAADLAELAAWLRDCVDHELRNAGV